MAAKPLPLARTATLDEAALVQRCLEPLGFATAIIADEELSGTKYRAVRVRGLEIGEDGLHALPLPGGETTFINWSDLLLLITARLVTRRVELKERKGESENEIIDATELFSDEAVLDLYSHRHPWRIMAHSFDFSCLREQKTLIAGENFSVLLRLIRERAQAVYDDSYNSLRATLEAVWPAEQQVESRGWRRERPGKISLGAIAETSNETQFTRYSRLGYLTITKRFKEI